MLVGWMQSVCVPSTMSSMTPPRSILSVKMNICLLKGSLCLFCSSVFIFIFILHIKTAHLHRVTVEPCSGYVVYVVHVSTSTGPSHLIIYIYIYNVFTPGHNQTPSVRGWNRRLQSINSKFTFYLSMISCHFLPSCSIGRLKKTQNKWKNFWSSRFWQVLGQELSHKYFQRVSHRNDNKF